MRREVEAERESCAAQLALKSALNCAYCATACAPACRVPCLLSNRSTSFPPGAPSSACCCLSWWSPTRRRRRALQPGSCRRATQRTKLRYTRGYFGVVPSLLLYKLRKVKVDRGHQVLDVGRLMVRRLLAFSYFLSYLCTDQILFGCLYASICFAQTEVLAVGAIEIAMFVMLCVDCCGGHEERLKSGHHKSRLRWGIARLCIISMIIPHGP